MVTNERKKILRWDDLPDVLTAQHIADYEGISRRRVYELFQTSPEHGGILSYGIGSSKRVEKVDFAEWKKAKKAESRQRYAV